MSPRPTPGAAVADLLARARTRVLEPAPAASNAIVSVVTFYAEALRAAHEALAATVARADIAEAEVARLRAEVAHPDAAKIQRALERAQLEKMEASSKYGKREQGREPLAPPPEEEESL